MKKIHELHVTWIVLAKVGKTHALSVANGLHEQPTSGIRKGGVVLAC